MSPRTSMLLRYALDAEGALRCADEFASSPAPQLICPSCKRPVELTTHPGTGTTCFAHKGRACKWALETVLLLLAKLEIERRGGLEVEGAGYRSNRTGAWRIFSPTGALELHGPPVFVPAGDIGPHLLLDISDNRDYRGLLVLVARCNHPWSAMQLMALPNLGGLVLGLDPCGSQGQVGSVRPRITVDMALSYQSEEFVADCLKLGSPSLSWITNDWRDCERMGLLSAEQVVLLNGDRAFEERFFKTRGIPVRKRSNRLGDITVPSCPLHESASLDLHCGAGGRPGSKCPHFIAKGRFYVGCSAPDTQPGT